METLSIKKKMLFDLLWELVQENQGEPVRITSETDQPFGIFVPFQVPQPIEPPKMTPEQAAELQSRLDTLDDSVTTEEMIELLKK